MEKVMWLAWGPAPTDRATLRDMLTEGLAPSLLGEATVLGLSMAVDDPQADVEAPLPWPADEKPLLAMVSVWLAAYDHRARAERVVHETTDRLGLAVHGYVVTESLYTEYGESPWSGPRDWPDGERSPGVLTVGLLQRPPDRERLAWLRHWHGVQSPESAELQPRTRYVRNLVALPLGDAAPPLDGIVEEAWPSNQHVADLDLFYRGDGDPARVQANLERMLANVTAFLDLAQFRSATMGEYLFRNPSAG